MANELCIPGANANTYYALITRKSDKYIYDVGDTAFEATGTWNDARIGECDIAMTPEGDKHYATFPTITAGVYDVEFRKQAGGSPAIADEVHFTGEMCWDGTAEITRSALDTLIDTVKAETVLIVEDTGTTIPTKLLKYVQLLTRKDAAIATDNATELTAINATGGSGAGTFDNQTDAEEAIRDAIVDANPQKHSATADEEVGNTTEDGGSYADTATNDGVNYYKTGPGDAVGGFGLNCILTFGIGTGRVATGLSVNGHFDAGAQRTIQVWGYDYIAGAYVQLSDSSTDFGNSGTDTTVQYSITRNMRQVSDGEVLIRFTSTSETGADVWWCDFVEVTSIAEEAAGLTADVIQQAVWSRSATGHDEDTLGYNIGNLYLQKGNVSTVTSTTQFVGDSGNAVNDSYNGMLIVVEDNTDDHYETRRIVDYIGATKEFFLDRALSFTPDSADEYYILSGGYGNVNLDSINSVVQTATLDTIKAETASIQVETTALDTLTKASGDGDLAAILNDTDLIDDATSGLVKIAEDVAAILVATNETIPGTITTLDNFVDTEVQAILDIVGHTDYGNAKLVRATTPANTLDIDADGRVDISLIEGADATDTINGSVAGPGDYAVTITVQTTGAVAIPGVCVWLNTSNARSGSVVKAAYTNDSGVVTFNLAYSTTYYVFCHLAGYSFANANITPVAGLVAFTKAIGTATSAGSDSDYDTSFLTRGIAQVREALDEPELNAKYSDTAIIRHMELAYPLILGEINRNSQTPVVAKYMVSITNNTAQYTLPSSMGSIYAIYEETTEGTRVFFDSRSRHNPYGRYVWIEGTTLNVQGSGILSVGTELIIEYIPSGVAQLHNGTCTLDTAGDTVTMGGTPHVGVLDTRDNVYAGCVFRILKADGTGDYIQERTITSHDRTGPTLELELALDPVPTVGSGSIYYEIAPTIYKGLDLVIPMYAAYSIASFEGQSQRAKSILMMYRDHIRNLRLSAYYSNLQDATKVRGDTYSNRRYRRF